MPAHAPRRAHVAGHLDRRFVLVQQYAAQVRPAATLNAARRRRTATLARSFRPARGDPPTDQVLGPGSPPRRSPRIAKRERLAILVGNCARSGLAAGCIASRSPEP
jgi:hypothetical protein